MTDDQRWDALWGMPTVLAALAGRGVTFTNGFVVNPECCPSRASLLTGRYSHSTGVFTNSPPRGGFTAFHDSTTLATALHGVGYRTALFGKYLNGYGSVGGFGPYVPPGWDDWSAFYGGFGYYDYNLAEPGRVVRHRDRPSDYSTSVLAAKAIDFVRHAPEPFFLELAPYAPHAPATAPPGHEDAFDDFSWWRPENFDERDVRDKPAYVRSHAPLTPAEVRFAADFRRKQLSAALAVDDAVFAVMQSLSRRGLVGRTVVVFTSDNGLAWGSHSMTARAKWAPYDEAIRVPLVIRYDALLHGRPTYDDHLVLNIDLAPTLAALAGAKLPDVDGRSLLPLLSSSDEAAAWRKDFLVEHLSAPHQLGVPTFCAVRSERYKYILYRTGEAELYDLARDPFELRNLAGRRVLAATEGAMQERLAALCAPAPPGLGPLVDALGN